MDIALLIPKDLVISSHSFEVKSLSRSEMILLGTPWVEMIVETSVFAAHLAFAFSDSG